MSGSRSEWYAGRWRTPEGIRRHRASRDARNAKRVYVGQLYVGMAPSPEHARDLNDDTRRNFSGRTQ